MNPILESLTGMNVMTDQVIASDFLISAKSGVWNYAIALTETASPEIRAVLQKHLEEAIDTHEKITTYMMQKGFYHPYNIAEQNKVDQTTLQTAISLPS